MMKLLTHQWLAAEQENKAIRDRLRKQFWSELGIAPAKNTAEIDIPASSRLELMQKLVEITLGGREADSELKRITSSAAAEIAGLAVGSFASPGSSLAPDMTQLAPKHLRKFFITQEKTAYEWSEFGDSDDHG